LDVMLPGIDGFAVATELRSARRFVPILMRPARGRSEDVLRGFGAGADDYLPKPFELPILLSRVRGLLRRHEWFRAEAAVPPAPEVAWRAPAPRWFARGSRVAAGPRGGVAVYIRREEHRLRAARGAGRREANAA